MTPEIFWTTRSMFWLIPFNRTVRWWDHFLPPCTKGDSWLMRHSGQWDLCFGQIPLNTRSHLCFHNSHAVYVMMEWCLSWVAWLFYPTSWRSEDNLVLLPANQGQRWGIWWTKPDMWKYSSPRNVEYVMQPDHRGGGWSCAFLYNLPSSLASI